MAAVGGMAGGVLRVAGCGLRLPSHTHANPAGSACAGSMVGAAFRRRHDRSIGTRLGIGTLEQLDVQVRVCVAMTRGLWYRTGAL